jgi:hypothetical protein
MGAFPRITRTHDGVRRPILILNVISRSGTTRFGYFMLRVRAAVMFESKALVA